MPKKIKEEEYQVERILKRRVVDDKIQYLVAWKGYYEHQATWEPAEFLENSKKLIKIFEKEQRNKRKQTLKKKIFQQKRNVLRKNSNKEKIRSFNQLKLMLQQSPTYHKPVSYQNPNQKAFTFQELINFPPNQIKKVKRYDYLKGEWIEKFQSCSELIYKTATRQKNCLILNRQKVNILDISTLKSKYTVRFQKDDIKHQCELNQLKLFRPIEVVDFLLKNYDPCQHKLRQSSTIAQYLKLHPEENYQESN